MSVDDNLEPFACMTRSDIARALKISSKQAGRLMDDIGFVRVGKSHRRVLVNDFARWLKERRVAPFCDDTTRLQPLLGGKQSSKASAGKSVLDEAKRISARRKNQKSV